MQGLQNKDLEEKIDGANFAPIWGLVKKVGGKDCARKKTKNPHKENTVWQYWRNRRWNCNGSTAFEPQNVEGNPNSWYPSNRSEEGVGRVLGKSVSVSVSEQNCEDASPLISSSKSWSCLMEVGVSVTADDNDDPQRQRHWRREREEEEEEEATNQATNQQASQPTNQATDQQANQPQPQPQQQQQEEQEGREKQEEREKQE